MKTLTLFLALALFAATATAADDLKSSLQRGLFEEEANRNLPAAISAYQSVLTQFDQDRALAATAVFRLGECYRKLEKTNDAVACYQRIVREFADSATLAKLSQQNLAALGTTPPATNQFQTKPAAIVSGEEAEIERLRAMLKDSPDLINSSRAPGATPLNTAVGAGQIRVVQFLLDQKVDLETKSQDGQNALLRAVEEGRNQIVELLLAHGADLRAINGSGETALHIAARRGYRTIVQTLLDRRANVNFTSSSGRTPLHAATDAGNKALVELLLNSGAELNVRDKTGFTPLHVAALKGNDALVELFLSRNAQADGQSGGNATPLSLAVAKGEFKSAELLLKAGADVNAKYNGSPVLHLAFSSGPEMLALVLAHKPDLENTDAYGFTPAQLLVMRQFERGLEMLQMVLKAGADPKKRFQVTENAPHESRTISISGGGKFLINGNTPLIIACRMMEKDTSGRGPISMINALIAGGANVNAKSTEGSAPLHYAVEARSLPMVEAILAAKPDIEARDRQGWNALALAIRWGVPKIAEKLLQAGADVNAKAVADASSAKSDFATMLHYAVTCFSKECVALLLENKAAVNSLNPTGETPYDLAKSIARRTQSSEERRLGEEIAALLQKHGADENFTRRRQITVTRTERNYTYRVFAKGTNDWNRYTLLELIATVYADPKIEAAKSLPFPDLSRVIIQRLDAKGGADQQIGVDVATLLNSGDCTNAPWLEWGDVVNFPEQDHPLGATWPGLSQTGRAALVKCLKREVEIVIKARSRKAILEPVFNLSLPPGVATPVLPLNVPITKSVESETGPMTLNVFRVNEVLKQSALLRVSSDLTRVHVKRNDPIAKKPVEWTVNLSPSASYDPGTDLWLRDGDVIVVPDKE